MDKHLSVKRRRSASSDTTMFDMKGHVASQRVVVPHTEIRRAKVAATNIPQIRSIVERICSDSVDRGMDVTLLHNDIVIKLQDSEKFIIETKWPLFVHAAIVDLLTLGYVIVGRSASNGGPCVISADLVNLVFVDSVTSPREYWVEKATSAGAAAFGSAGKTNERIDALVFINNPPDAQGHLTSPVHTAVRYAEKIEEVLANQAAADFVRAHLPFVYEPDLDRMRPPDPAERDMVLPGEVQAAWSNWHQGIVRQVQSNMAMMQKATEQLSTSAPAAVASTSILGTPLVPDDVQRAPPGSRYICLPAGLRLVPPVVPQQNALFQQQIDYYTLQIMSAFKVPLAVLDVMPSSNRYTAPVQESHRRYYRLIETYQSMMSMLVGETFMWANDVVLDQYAAATLHKFKDLQESALLAVNAYLAGRTKSGKAKRTKSSGAKKPKKRSTAAGESADDTNGFAVDEDSDYDEDDTSAAAAAPPAKTQKSSSSSKKAEKTPENPLDELADVENVPELKPEEPGSNVLKATDTPETLERAKRILGTDPKSILDAAKRQFSVRVEFKSQPQYEFNELVQILQLGAIGMEQFARQASAVLGINEKSMLLTQKQRLEEAEQQLEVTEARMPAPEEGAAAAAKKPAAAAASKKTASSSSSSDKPNKVTKQPQK